MSRGVSCAVLSVVLWVGMLSCGVTQEVGRVPEGSDFRFSLPLACKEEDGCRIVQFVDMGGGRDFSCGTRSKRGHRGTDYGLPSLSRVWKEGVKVRAAADGVVLVRRDGFVDIPGEFLGLGEGEGADWGNYVVVDHGGGWRSVYAHMRKGSLLVGPGEFVRRGDDLGVVGFSGLTGYPHLHFEVLKDSRPYDPYSGRFMGGGCGEGGQMMQSRFDRDALESFSHRTTELFEFGFSDRESVSVWSGLNGFLRREYVSSGSRDLGLYSLVAGTRRGDVWQFEVVSAGGDVLVDKRGEVLEGSWMDVLGVVLPYRGNARPQLGRYRGRFTLFRRKGEEWVQILRDVEEVDVRR